MKTVAVTMDPPTLRVLDELVKELGRNRSDLVREAVRQFVVRAQRRRDEEKDAKIYYRHRKLINRQAAALVRDQARTK